METPITNNSSGKIQSVCFYTNYGNDPCAYLRLRGPLHHLGINIIDGVRTGRTYPERIYQGDVIVLQRDFPRNMESYEKIVQLAHQENKPIIYDIDDLLLLMPEEHPERQSQHYIRSLLPMMQALYEADLITTTTPELQVFLRQFNNNVILLPNYFDDSLWGLRKPTTNDGKKHPLIIGYMGSESHAPDLMHILPVITTLLDRYPESINFNFWGVRPPEAIAAFPQVNWIPAFSYHYDDFAGYFQKQNADIFIAPLIDNPFNQAKSPLKFFEYSALGVPGVYSRLKTFEQAITHQYDGLLAYSQEEWLENLTLLIENPSLRIELANNAQTTIKNNWLLSKNAYQWLDAYSAIIQSYDPKARSNKAGYELIRSVNQQYYSFFKIKDNEIQSLTSEIETIKASRSWKLAMQIRQARNYIAPPESKREKIAKHLYHWMKGQKVQSLKRKRRKLVNTLLDTKIRVSKCMEVNQHKEVIDIIICVHNALDDVRKCIESVITKTSPPFYLIIVDDGSNPATQHYLEEFAASYPECQLIRNDKALGYTRAANIGMKVSKAPFFVLLNSDTIVTSHWIDRMVRALTENEETGVVGPLSNTASWQSIPKLSENGDWAINDLPWGITPENMSSLVAKYSACVHPSVPLLNGFCMMVRKDVIDEIGFFDEENFGGGYGEEDDFIIRASKAGWKIAVVDDAYIYHAQSKSYTDETRFALQKQSGENLRKKHGAERIIEKVDFMNPNRVMDGIRARASIILDREDYIKMGREQFNNKRVLFVLPVLDAGGGGNVILDEAKYMLDMGVDVNIFNLPENKTGFLENYAHINIPLIFEKIQNLPAIANSFDAVVASANYSVPWLKPLQDLDKRPILAYYVQGFEPLMYQAGSDDYNQALESYIMIDGLVRFTKTRWTRNAVLEHTGADSAIVGISVNIDLFRPRDMVPVGLKPVTIVAMIRPGSPYRNPEITATILREVSKKYRKDVDIWFFGANDVREVVDEKMLDFEWRQLGKLTQIQVAAMMSKADIFTDFSSHQAMGLSALEAMAAGCSVIVPKNGGAVEFVNHRVNGMVANTSFLQACIITLEELIEDDQLRKNIQINSISDVVQYYPERVSYNILNTLFS